MAITQQQLVKNRIQSGDIINFFDCLTDILLKYSGGELVKSKEFRKCFSSYMLCRYISMKESLIKYAEYLNIMQTKLTAEQLYILAYKLIPKQTSGYIKYIKSNKKEEKNIEEKINNNNDINTILFDI